MSREIKFRAWNPDDNKIEHPLVFAMSKDKVLIPLIKCADGNRAYKNYQLMQYTGRKDKNGVEIYEGDIVKCIAAPSGKKVAGEMIGKIIQDHFGWTISVWFNDEWWGYGKMNFTSLEVIGNIYSNPELVTRAVGV